MEVAAGRGRRRARWSRDASHPGDCNLARHPGECNLARLLLLRLRARGAEQPDGSLAVHQVAKGDPAAAAQQHLDTVRGVEDDLWPRRPGREEVSVGGMMGIGLRGGLGGRLKLQRGS